MYIVCILLQLLSLSSGRLMDPLDPGDLLSSRCRPKSWHGRLLFLRMKSVIDDAQLRRDVAVRRAGFDELQTRRRDLSRWITFCRPIVL